ncbi:MAG: TatD family deoxyribonuclease [Deltaproteobacteria bacterium]|nr:MAG: TatD family deoxyribonuclease [Deltaproteobacteria bacterium]
MTGAFDAHAHLDQLGETRLSEVLGRARAAGVDGFALAGANPEHWDHLEAIARRVGALWQLGLHPWWAQALDEAGQDAVLARLEQRLSPHGIGETGLDATRARDDRSRQLQERAYRLQLDLAQARNLPVVLHGVRAWGRVLELLPRDTDGVLHAFTGSPELAEQAVRRGLHVSFGRTLFDSPRTREAARRVPGGRLLLESDAPDGGEPADLPKLAALVAELRGEDPAERLAESSENARRLFRA